MQIRELVGDEIVSVDPESSLRKAAQEMDSAGVGSVAVESDGALNGIFTERDMLRAVSESADFDTDHVGDWMTDCPDAFSPEMNVEDAANWMLATGYRHLPVVDVGVVIGMVSIKDVLWAMTGPTRV